MLSSGRRATSMSGRAASRIALMDRPPFGRISVLALRQPDDQPVQRLTDRELAGEPGVGFRQRRKAQHARLLRAGSRGSDPGKPALVDIDVARRAGAFAAAI